MYIYKLVFPLNFTLPLYESHTTHPNGSFARNLVTKNVLCGSCMLVLLSNV